MNFLSSLHNKNTALLLVRIALASAFIYHGWSKLQGMEGAIGFFASIGLASFWVYIVAWVEFLGGILMLFGIKVREVGVLFAIILFVAIYKVHLGQGFKGLELQFVLLLASLAMVFSGAGRYSLLKDKTCANCSECANCQTCKDCKDGVCKCK